MLLQGYIIYVAQPGATKIVGKGIPSLNGICSLNYTESKNGKTCEMGIGVIPMGTPRPLGEGNNTTLCHNVGVYHGVSVAVAVAGRERRNMQRQNPEQNLMLRDRHLLWAYHCSWCTQHQKESRGS